MNRIVGFTVMAGLSERNQSAAHSAQTQALSHFKHICQQRITIGEITLEVWGQDHLSERIVYMEDGSVFVLVGTPHGSISLVEITRAFAHVSFDDRVEWPWDGRFILLRIHADGSAWTLWNDWVGSIPVFHARIQSGWIASTIEPVVVASAGISTDDIHGPGLVSLLINGHFLADWTLFTGMKRVPPDCVAEWGEGRFRWARLWTIQPTADRWETRWDELIDEMYELTRRAIREVLETHPSWVLPLSSGLDSRLIAAVGADMRADIRAYAWGAPESTDVIYSRQIAQRLGLPWQHVDVGKDFLVKYTRQWADWFGSSMHFHGMYQMAFLDAIKMAPHAAVVSGFIGDTLSGDVLSELTRVHSLKRCYQLENEWYVHWEAEELDSLLHIDISDALEANAEELQRQYASFPGSRFQRIQMMELWGRQHGFTYFQSVLSDYWRGVATPFMNRAYARFAMSLPAPALYDRRLLGDVYRRYYRAVAAIPGTYGEEPFLLSGRYLLWRRLTRTLPCWLRRGPFQGLEDVQLRMDTHCVQANGWNSLWPLGEAREHLAGWIDVEQLDRAYRLTIENEEDIRPLRKLQSIQALAYRLLGFSRRGIQEEGVLPKGMSLCVLSCAGIAALYDFVAVGSLLNALLIHCMTQ